MIAARVGRSGRMAKGSLGPRNMNRLQRRWVHHGAQPTDTLSLRHVKGIPSLIAIITGAYVWSNH